MEKKTFTRHYRTVWETEPKFSGWLAHLPEDDTKAYCKVCKCVLQAHKRDLSKHGNCKKDAEAFKFSQAGSSNAKMTTFFREDICRERKIAELKISALVAEHCSVKTVDHLSSMISGLDNSSSLLSGIKLHRTKCTGLIKNVIAPMFLKELIESIGDNSYSMIIDESTCVDQKKMLCIMVRYYGMTTLKVETRFYKLVEIEGGDANTITTAFKSQLINDGLNIQNLIGVVVDGANVMVGPHHSFSSIIKVIVPHLIVVKFVSHSLHLAVENACKMLPTHLDYLVRECHNWFSCSSKRQIEYNMIYQTLTDTNPLKIDKLSGTRWLARIEAISKIIEQWDALQLHFNIAKSKEHCYAAEQLHLLLSNHTNKLYMLFLQQSLRKITDVNKMFQSVTTEPLKLLEELQNLLLNYLSLLIPPDRLQSVNKDQLSNFKFNDYIMNINCIQFGYYFNVESEKVSQNDLKKIKEDCCAFLIRICEEIQKRVCDTNVKILKNITFFTPTTATSEVRADITAIVTHFYSVIGSSNIDLTLNEWRILPNCTWKNTDSTEQFWGEVHQYKNAAGVFEFKNIARLATALLSLPISNASVERAFSVMSVIKCKLCNKLLTETTEAIMRVKCMLKKCNRCINFKPSETMLDKFHSENVYIKNIEEHVVDDALDTFAQLG